MQNINGQLVSVVEKNGEIQIFNILKRSSKGYLKVNLEKKFFISQISEDGNFFAFFLSPYNEGNITKNELYFVNLEASEIQKIDYFQDIKDIHFLSNSSLVVRSYNQKYGKLSLMATIINPKEKATRNIDVPDGKLFIGNNIVLLTDTFHDLNHNGNHIIMDPNMTSILRKMSNVTRKYIGIDTIEDYAYAIDSHGNVFQEENLGTNARYIGHYDLRGANTYLIDEQVVGSFSEKNQKIKVFNFKQNKVISEFSLPEKADFLKFLTPSLAIYYKDRGAVIYDCMHQKEIFTYYFFTNGNWIVIAPDGYFDGSPELRKYLYMKTSSGESVPIDDATYQKYHSPQVITNMLNQAFTTTKKPNGENK